MMLPAGPIRAPANGCTQNAPLGKAAHPSRAASPLLRRPRTAKAAPNSSHPTPEMTKGSTIWRKPVRRQAENKPSRAAVATSWTRR
jgi:hypothetical protein